MNEIVRCLCLEEIKLFRLNIQKLTDTREPEQRCLITAVLFETHFVQTVDEPRIIVVFLVLVFVLLVEGLPAHLTSTLAFGLGVLILAALWAGLAIKMTALVTLLPLWVLVLLWCSHGFRKQKEAGRFKQRGQAESNRHRLPIIRDDSDIRAARAQLHRSRS